MPNRLTRATPAAAAPTDVDEAEVNRIVSALRKDGIIKLDGRFAEQAARIAERYDIREDRYEPSDAYLGQWLNLALDDDVLQLSLDPVLLTALARYYRAQPYLRDVPVIGITYPWQAERTRRATSTTSTPAGTGTRRT